MSSKKVVLCNIGVGVDTTIDALQWGLQELGYAVTVENAAVDEDAINILFAAFRLTHTDVLRQAPRSINFNLDFIGGEFRPAIGARYFALMRNIPNWDYCSHNVNALKAAGITDTSLLPFGYAPTLARIEPMQKDIDVLFYGSMSDRRIRIVDAIAKKGLKVVWTKDGFWTPEQRDEYIARSKIVLEMPFYDGVHLFSEARASYLLANRVTVVSELNDDTIIEEDMRQSIVGAPQDELADLCVEYCADSHKREAIAERGYALFRQRDWMVDLKRMMEDYEARNPLVSRAAKHDVTPPGKLNIGAGQNWRFDHFNIDSDASTGADLVFDLSQPFPFDSYQQSWRFGRIRLGRNTFDTILAVHVFEQMDDIARCMTTCLEWLKVGGTLEVEVYYDLSSAAWANPKHRRGFNEQSWQGYTVDCWRIGWRTHCFDIVSHVHLLTELGQSLAKAGVTEEVILRTPRAIDSLQVTLIKRALTDAEILETEQQTCITT